MIISFVVYIEVLFSNHPALKFVDKTRQNTIINFLQVMDCLIDTLEGIDELMKSHVISYQSMTLINKYIVEMWETMHPLFFKVYAKFHEDLEHTHKKVSIPKYYKIESEVLIQNHFTILVNSIS